LLLRPTNNGKSLVVEKFQRDRTPDPREATDSEALPVVVVQMPTNPTISGFYGALLAEVGAPANVVAAVFAAMTWSRWRCAFFAR